jgi:hypothetical protein
MHRRLGMHIISILQAFLVNQGLGWVTFEQFHAALLEMFGCLQVVQQEATGWANTQSILDNVFEASVKLGCRMHPCDVGSNFPLLCFADDNILALSELLIDLGVPASHPPEATYEAVQKSVSHRHAEESGGSACPVKSIICVCIRSPKAAAGRATRYICGINISSSMDDVEAHLSGTHMTCPGGRHT